MVKFGRTDPECDFEDLARHRREGTVAPLLRTIEGWLRAERDGKRRRGVKVVEEAEGRAEELRGLTGNGYLSGRFNNGFN